MAHIAKQDALLLELCEKSGVAYTLNAPGGSAPAASSAATAAAEPAKERMSRKREDAGSEIKKKPAAPPKIRANSADTPLPAERLDAAKPDAPTSPAPSSPSPAPSPSNVDSPLSHEEASMSLKRRDAKKPVPAPKTHAARPQSVFWTAGDGKKKNEDFAPPLKPCGRVPEKAEATYDGCAEPALPANVDALLSGSEDGVIWDFDPFVEQWSKSKAKINIDKSSFAAGAVRKAFKMRNLSEPDVLYVAKFSKSPQKDPRESYFYDVEMISHCELWAKKFNRKGAPKPVTFLKAWVIELIDRTGNLNICGVEPFIEGEYQKHSNNSGAILGDRNTPQAFSHFTYEESKHELVIVDIQGVEDVYTDPQIHTKSGVGYGVGNLGQRGIERWVSTHTCNSVCVSLGLPTLGVNSRAAKRKLYRGTMMLPDLKMVVEDDAAAKGEEHEQQITGKLAPAVSWKAHSEDCVALVYNQHTDNLITGGKDRNIVVWDIATQEAKLKMRNTKEIEALVLKDPHTLVSSDTDGTIKVWNLETGEATLKLMEHRSEVKALAFALDDDNVLVSASMDKFIKIWDLRAAKCVATLSAHDKGIKALTVSAQCLFSGSNDDTIKLWDLRGAKFVYNLEGHEKSVLRLTVRGTRLFSGSADSTVKVWDLNSLKCTKTLQHGGSVNALGLAGDNLISAGEGVSLLVWNKNLESAWKLEDRSSLWDVLVARNSVFGAAMDGSVKIWSWA
jgi:myosin-heavy-chain kinase